MKKEPFLPNHNYLIKNSGNNFETLFLEERNYSYFLALFQKHVGQIATLEAFRFFSNKFELLIRIKDSSQIPHKYQDRLHQPFSNFFNAYCKAINKMYGRSGSLFREHFKRIRIDDGLLRKLKNSMNERPITAKNLIRHKIPNHLRSSNMKIHRESKLSLFQKTFRIAALVALFFTLNAFCATQRQPKKFQPINDSIPKILYTYLPKLKESTSRDSLIFPYEPFYDEQEGKYMVIGRLVDDKAIHAISATAKDSSITFYEYQNPEWKIVGKEKLVNFDNFYFEDMDGDTKNELVAQSGTNMNGNREYTIFRLSQKVRKIERICDFFGRYQLIPGKKLAYSYEGSWYSDNIYTLYQWKDDKLLPIRSVTLHLKNPEKTNVRQIIFEQNKKFQDDVMVEIFNQTYSRKNKTHRYVIEHIFDDNFQLK